MILDRFGNNLGEIEFNQDVKGVSFSEDGLFVTIFSGGRAAVFEIESRERIGSTSFRNTSLLYANYSSKDNIIVAITGAGKEEFTDLEGHAVNIEARKIVRKNIDGTITQIHQPRLYRTGSGRYALIGFDQTFAFMRSVGDGFLSAYVPILERRKDVPWTEVQRQWQLYRRGRYVEFNLVHDRGTLFGLQTNGRTEAILMSLPPLVRWEYGYSPDEGSPEATLMTDFLRPRDWLGLETAADSR